MTRNDVLLGIAALVLVAFSLFVSLVVPRRRPDFPGRRLRAFVVVCVVLVAGMLGAVEVFGEGHDFGEAGAGEVKDTGPTDTQTTPTATAPTATLPEETTETGGGRPEGDAAAGEAVFTDAGCNGCHALEEAGATGQTGPDLDESLKGKDTNYIDEAIVVPNADIAEGYGRDIMPQDYGERLSSKQIADLVAFLDEATK